MPGWGEIANEIAAAGGDLDGVRLKYLHELASLSDGRRAVISYSSGWLNDKTGPVAVEGDDVHSFMETCRGVSEPELDVIVHSPGGSAQAAEKLRGATRGSGCS